MRRERRPPTAAIAWVLGLALLPYLALPLYLLFGQRKLRAVPKAATLSSNPNAHWAAVLLSGFGLPPPGPAQVRFHTDGLQSRDALWGCIENARRDLDVCTFLIGDDHFGRDIVERLVRQARRGVRVRILLDGFGAALTPRRSLRDLRMSGAEVVFFRPLLRNHRKMIIADGTRLWAGGRNLAAEYFLGRDGAPPWVDLTFDLTGEVAAVAGGQFQTDWLTARGESSLRAHSSPESVIAPPPQFLPSGPDQAEDTAQALLVDACFRARDRLLAVTPYFLPDDSLRVAMRLASRRGVRITLVLPAVSNHRVTDFVRGRALRELTDAGAEVRLLPRMVHAKAVVIDDMLGLCGSMNLDRRSLLLNYECAVLFYGEEQTTWLTNGIDALASQGTLFDSKPLGLLSDLAEGLLLALAFEL
ncbi:MAG: phospholipase D-like domain-containing protein [Gammaproteobacteria bacterium]